METFSNGQIALMVAGALFLLILVYRWGYVTAYDQCQWAKAQIHHDKRGFYAMPDDVEPEATFHLQIQGTLYRYHRETQQCGWHAPGIGEVHAFDHSFMIYCEKSLPFSDDSPDHQMDNDLAQLLCAHLNRTGFTVPRPGDKTS